jgi:FixJ family two-component response regulator
LAESISERKERILVVDDDRLFCESLAEALRAEGHEVCSCVSPEQAMAEAESPRLDLAFVDVNMPDMSGTDLAEKLMARRTGLQVVLMSGRGTFDTLVRALQIGAYDFLPKPLTQGDLHLCLTRCRERRALRRHIELAEERHFTLIQNIPLLIFRLRRDLSLEFVNQACSSMLGVSPGEAMRTDAWLEHRVHEDDLAMVRRVVGRAFELSTPLSVQCRLKHARGYDVHGILKSLAAPPGTEDPLEDFLDCIFVDISERVYLESALVLDEKLKTLGAISAEVAHEIRNPLMSIGGFARRLALKAPDFPETEIILRESKRLEKLLERIHGYLDPVEVCHCRVSANEVVTEALERMASRLAERGLTAETDLDPALPDTEADPNLLRQVAAILIQEAVKSQAQGGTLAIRSFAKGEAVHLAFRYRLADPKQVDMERMYMPFEDGNSGLPLAYRLVRRLKGVLTLSREGDKAVFVVALPHAHEG